MLRVLLLLLFLPVLASGQFTTNQRIFDTIPFIPPTKIYIQSILPLNPTAQNFPQHYDKQGHVIHTNPLLQEVARLAQCTYINLFPLFLDEQRYLDKKYTDDGLHLKPAGYELWIKHLRETGTL